MARTHESTNLQSMSRLKENAYGTPRPFAVGAYKRILQTDLSRWNFGSGTANDAGHAKGSDLAENVWNTTNDASKSFQMQANYQDAGLWFYSALGNIETAGTNPDFLHTITPMAGAGGQLPSRTFLEKSNGVYKLIPGVCVNQLTFSGSAGEENDGRQGLSAEVMGSGLYTENPASYVDPGNQTGLEALYNHFASLTLDGSDSEGSALSCDLANWEWSFNNNLQAFYDNCAPEFITGTPASGLVKNAMLLGQRNYTFKFTAYEQPGDPTLNWLKNGAILNIESNNASTDTTTTSYNINIVHQRGRVTSCERTAVKKNYNAITGTIDLLSLNGSIPLTVSIANNVPSYLV